MSDFAFILIFIIYVIYKYLKKGIEKVNKNWFIAAIVIGFIITPLYLFGYVVPHKLVKGERDMVSVVHYQDEEYELLVTYDVIGVDTVQLDDEGNKTKSYVRINPVEIHWDSGFVSKQTWKHAEGRPGTSCELIDQSGREFEVEIPELEFEYTEQLAAINPREYILFGLCYVSSICLIFVYFKQKDDISKKA